VNAGPVGKFDGPDGLSVYPTGNGCVRIPAPGHETGHNWFGRGRLNESLEKVVHPVRMLL
jgi:hypothetical protein